MNRRTAIRHVTTASCVLLGTLVAMPAVAKDRFGPTVWLNASGGYTNEAEMGIDPFYSYDLDTQGLVFGPNVIVSDRFQQRNFSSSQAIARAIEDARTACENRLVAGVRVQFTEGDLVVTCSQSLRDSFSFKPKLASDVAAE